MAPPQAKTFEEVYGFIPRFVLTATGAEYPSLVAAAEDAPSLSLDLPALNISLRSGFFLDGATPFREIRRVCPPPRFAAPRTLSRDAAIDGYIDLFRQAISRIPLRPSIIGLSGGCDSRHILLELLAQNRLPDQGVTVYAPSRPTEQTIAADVARRVGIPHVIVSQKPSQAVDDEIIKNEATDFMSLQHSWSVCMTRVRGAFDWWDGIAGGILSAGAFVEPWNLQLYRENRLDELADRLVPRIGISYFKDKDLFPREAAVAAIRTEVARHVHAPNPVGSFYLWNRTRVDISAYTFGMMRKPNHRTLAPYLDWDVWEFLSALPAEMFMDHKFHVDTVARAYPDFADIPYFQDRIKVGMRHQYPKVLALLFYTITRGWCDSRHWLRNLGRIGRLILDPATVDKVDFSTQLTVYMTELHALASGRRRKRYSSPTPRPWP